METPKSQSMTMQERKDLISSLAKKFQSDKDNYENSSFNESSARQNFIDQFLGALGWDVANEKGSKAERRDVKIEPPIIVQGMTKRADYTLCISGNARLLYLDYTQYEENFEELYSTLCFEVVSMNSF